MTVWDGIKFELGRSVLGLTVLLAIFVVGAACYAVSDFVRYLRGRR